MVFLRLAAALCALVDNFGGGKLVARGFPEKISKFAASAQFCKLAKKPKKRAYASFHDCDRDRLKNL